MSFAAKALSALPGKAAAHFCATCFRLGKEELHGHATIDIFDIRPKGSGAPA
jgi:hypothetical protein